MKKLKKTKSFLQQLIAKIYQKKLQKIVFGNTIFSSNLFMLNRKCYRIRKRFINVDIFLCCFLISISFFSLKIKKTIRTPDVHESWFNVCGTARREDKEKKKVYCINIIR
jgi:hypothetical protein